jgi:hypothetical protein
VCRRAFAADETGSYRPASLRRRSQCETARRTIPTSINPAVLAAILINDRQMQRPTREPSALPSRNE